MGQVKHLTFLLGLLAILVASPVVLAEIATKEEGALDSSGVTVVPTLTGAHVAISVEGKEDITLSILSGEKKVRTLYRGSLGPGSHTFVWDGKNEKGIQLPPGPYVVDVYSSTTGPYREGFFTSGL